MTWWVCSETGRIVGETEEKRDALAMLGMHEDACFVYDTEKGERIEKADLAKALSESA